MKTIQKYLYKGNSKNSNNRTSHCERSEAISVYLVSITDHHTAFAMTKRVFRDAHKLIQLVCSIAFIFLMLSCEKEQNKAVLDSNFSKVKPSILSPIDAYILEILPVDSTSSITFKWNLADYGVSAQVNYYLQIDLATNNFAKAYNLATVQSDSFASNIMAFNDILLTRMKLPANEISSLQLRVFSTLGNNNDTLYSEVIAIQIKTYKYVAPPVVTIPTILYLPGDYQAIVGDPSQSDVKTISTVGGADSTKIFEAYVYFPSITNIKITGTPDLTHVIYGSASVGKLSTDATAGNIKITAEGNYKVVVDISKLTYSLTPVSTWGILGTATANDWTKSTPMIYDKTKNVWIVTADLKNGALKFRANDDWALNYGPAVSEELSGNLITTDASITIAEAGNYTITMDLSRSKAPFRYSYKITKN